MWKAARVMLILTPLLALLPLSLATGCRNPGGPSSCADEDLEYNSTYTVIIQYRVEVVDTRGAPVSGANVRVTYHKVHCEGNLSDEDVDEGTTGAEGVFTNALSTVKRTYRILNREELVVMGLAVQKGGWIRQETRTYTERELKQLSGHRITQLWVATYDGS